MASEREHPTPTAAGDGRDDPRVVWGINSWVLVEAGARTVQRQVSTTHELEDLLLEVGVEGKRAHELALEQWRDRPAGADLPAPGTGGAVWRSTGLPRADTLLILLGVLALFFVVLLLGTR